MEEYVCFFYTKFSPSFKLKLEGWGKPCPYWAVFVLCVDGCFSPWLSIWHLSSLHNSYAELNKQTGVKFIFEAQMPKQVITAPENSHAEQSLTVRWRESVDGF